MQRIFVHIEKTGGNTVQNRLLATHGEEAVWRYQNDTNTLQPHSRKIFDYQDQSQIDRISKLAQDHPHIRSFGAAVFRAYKKLRADEPVEVFRKADVVSGHFEASRFEQYYREDAQLITVIREPLERMKSHYRYLRQHNGAIAIRGANIATTDTFEDFALSNEMRNFQSKNIDLPLEDFASIGLTSHLAPFFEEIGTKPIRGELPVLNKGTYSIDPDLDPGFIRDFRELNSDDYRLFDQVSERWDISH